MKVSDPPKLEPIKWPATPEERDRIIHEKVMRQPLECRGVLKEEIHEIPSRSLVSSPVSFALWHCPVCKASGYDQAPTEHEQPGPVPPYTQDFDSALLVWREVCLIWPKRLPGQDFPGRFARELGGISLLASVGVEQVAQLTAEQIALASLTAIGLEVVNE